jgi:hypothetical protein
MIKRAARKSAVLHLSFNIFHFAFLSRRPLRLCVSLYVFTLSRLIQTQTRISYS